MQLLFSITLAGLLLWACGDDFTTVAPTGILSDDALQNATGVDLKLTAAYSAIDKFVWAASFQVVQSQSRAPS